MGGSCCHLKRSRVLVKKKVQMDGLDCFSFTLKNLNIFKIHINILIIIIFKIHIKYIYIKIHLVSYKQKITKILNYFYYVNI